MSIFSEKLNYFINNSNIKIAELSRLSGVERSYIQKMITGERMPKKNGAPTLEHLADALMLTPAERRTLTEAYKISQMGEATYYRRVMVKRIIEDCESYYNQQLLPHPALSAQSVQRPEVYSVQGKASVQNMIQLFLMEEICLEKPHLMAVLQPESDAAELVQPYCRMKRELCFEHIVCFDNELQYQKDNQYNLQCIRTLLPFLLSPCLYSGWFYYDSVASHMSRHAVFPWFVLVHLSVLCLS